MLGDAPQEEQEAFNSVREASGKIEEEAVRDFRKNCTKQNLEKRLQRHALSQLLGREEPIVLPPETRRLLPPGLYVVQKGESLSLIAEKFYGQQNLWDVIYLENADAIGNDPDRVPTGITLRIP
jgi:nucleoid-associated protein YgaU